MNIDGWMCLVIFVVEGIAIGWICYRAGYESRSRYIKSLIDTILGLCVDLEMTFGEFKELLDGLED
jgi:hypothetical protein